MTRRGWIPLQRKIRETPIYRELPFDRAHAWFDILLSVNHAPGKLQVKGRMIHLRPGQRVFSYETLARDWGWSKGRVRRFLNMLIKDSMISISTSRGRAGSLLTVTNWDEHQGTPDAAQYPTQKQARSATQCATQSRPPNNGASADPRHGQRHRPRTTNGQVAAQEQQESTRRNNTPLSPHGFQKFIDAYPKKRRVEDALSVWAERDLEDKADRIVAAVKAQARTEEWTRQQGKYVPLPVNYLRKERWKEAPVTRKRLSVRDETHPLHGKPIPCPLWVDDDGRRNYIDDEGKWKAWNEQLGRYELREVLT